MHRSVTLPGWTVRSTNFSPARSCALPQLRGCRHPIPARAYVGEQAAPPDIARLPAALRADNEPILWAVGHEYPAPVEAPTDADVLLAGVAASPGFAEGAVRVVRGHEDMHRLVDGHVLVCQVTSPAWAPLFPSPAVVADGGGVLSHAAIAAREHGLPAVLGTGNGTGRLQDDQRVRIDGTRGLVLAIESPARTAADSPS